VNLAAFTGTPVVVPLHANLMAIAITAAGLILLAWVTLAVQSRLARGRGTTQALRVGERAGRGWEPHVNDGQRHAAAAGPNAASLRAAWPGRRGPASHSADLRASCTTKRSAREGGK
jgi:hypothetical protein